MTTVELAARPEDVIGAVGRTPLLAMPRRYHVVEAEDVDPRYLDAGAQAPGARRQSIHRRGREGRGADLLDRPPNTQNTQNCARPTRRRFAAPAGFAPFAVLREQVVGVFREFHEFCG